MSQDNPPNSQPPSSPEPRRNRRQRRNQDETQPRQTRYQKPAPFWKLTIIQLLRGTIGILETTVDKLETQPTTDTEETPKQGWWGAILISIRAVLPTGLSSQLSDTFLSSAIAIITVVAVWGTSSFFAHKPTEVATVPQTPIVQETTPPIVTTPTEPELLPTPLPIPSVEATEPPVVEKEKTEDKPVEEETAVVTEEPIPEPTPEFVPLTPEQILIAAIENKVGEVSKGAALGLVKSIQANFRNSSLIVTINDDWYTLKKSQQDKLVADIFQRSRELDFSHLEIFDSQDKLVARNPVVGKEMIIFQRELIAEQTS
ncbi:hypothetical protein [Brunnivagina elsteri]|uniref:Uncharacterized protein n=1 Tax=Brunnivagina elsteri CCALA 953 TaxID=987040 RepID=A0A2A2TDF5_9CYAN|nr:hypothetical protein [Calothrix elsteri]PAX51678.1 hypothetical protein CK510_23540 [Calothrix elsteri CCALA 953]